MIPDLSGDLKKLLSVEDKELITRIKSILGPFILRRLKSDVMQQLVPKMQRVCSMLANSLIKQYSNIFIFKLYKSYNISGRVCGHGEAPK